MTELGDGLRDAIVGDNEIRCREPPQDPAVFLNLNVDPNRGNAGAKNRLGRCGRRRLGNHAAAE